MAVAAGSRDAYSRSPSSARARTASGRTRPWPGSGSRNRAPHRAGGPARRHAARCPDVIGVDELAEGARHQLLACPARQRRRLHHGCGGQGRRWTTDETGRVRSPPAVLAVRRPAPSSRRSCRRDRGGRPHRIRWSGRRWSGGHRPPAGRAPRVDSPPAVGGARARDGHHAVAPRRGRAEAAGCGPARAEQRRAAEGGVGPAPGPASGPEQPPRPGGCRDRRRRPDRPALGRPGHRGARGSGAGRRVGIGRPRPAVRATVAERGDARVPHENTSPLIRLVKMPTVIGI